MAIGLLGFASFPLFVLILERLLLRRQWTRAQGRDGAAGHASGLVAARAGVLAARTAIVQGLAWGLVSGFTFALLAVLNRRLRRQRAAPSTSRSGRTLTAALCLLPFAWASPAALGAIGARDVALILVLGLVCTALAHTLFIAALRAISAHTASVIAALEPVYGIVLALLLLGEVPGARTLAGGALIVGAAVRRRRATRRADVGWRESRLLGSIAKRCGAHPQRIARGLSGR